MKKERLENYRVCEYCLTPVKEGYLIDTGVYACADGCLNKLVSPKSKQELVDMDALNYVVYDSIDDPQYKYYVKACFLMANSTAPLNVQVILTDKICDYLKDHGHTDIKLSKKFIKELSKDHATFKDELPISKREEFIQKRLKILAVYKNNRKRSLESERLVNKLGSSIIELKHRNSDLLRLLEAKEEEIKNQTSEIITYREKEANYLYSALLKMSTERVIEVLKILDVDGWFILRHVENILNYTTKDLYGDLIIEDSLGFFEETDGHELVMYIEKMKFSESYYERIGNQCELTHFQDIDKTSKHYQDYQIAKNNLLLSELTTSNKLCCEFTKSSIEKALLFII